ncbi:hypothetical protein [Ensifer adhaerens]
MPVIMSALAGTERTVASEDPAYFDEVAGLARDFLNQKRELVELYEQRKDVLAEQGVAEPRDALRDPANAERDAAVVKHGQAVVDAGNDALAEIDHYRGGLDGSGRRRIF